MTRHRLAFAAALVTLAAAGAAAAQSTPDYTGDLNAMPARPAAASPTPAQRPVPVTPPAERPQTQAQPQPQSQPGRTEPAPVRTAPASASTVPAPQAAAPVSVPATVPAPVPAPAPSAPRALTRAEIDALPFTVTLPEGYALTAGRPGPDFQVWTVRKNGLAQLMIYAGPSAQFPIHDGEQVEVGARTTVVVVEEGRRRALEHLFRQSTAPNHIHVWIASVDGADRDRAEAIGHGVSPR